jgi:hypothetical protein
MTDSSNAHIPFIALKSFLKYSPQTNKWTPLFNIQAL